MTDKPNQRLALIKAKAEEMTKLTDDELKAKTAELRARLEQERKQQAG